MRPKKAKGYLCGKCEEYYKLREDALDCCKELK